ncbi:MAG TPA: O-antigen ligase family protein [Blastocatellia bacterium]|nr:O-antigen ligase family protein [Blastocatellia bacterium]
MSGQRVFNSKKDHLSKTIAVGFLITLVFTALAHGAVEPWSVFIFELMIVVLLVLWSIKVLADRTLKVNIPSLILPVAALALLGLVQSIAFTDSTGRWVSLSKNVGFTRAAVTVVVFVLISFVIAANFFSSRGRLGALANFLVVYGLAMALFGLVQHFSWNHRFYWLRPTEVTNPFGPFANHNHFAGYMELLIALPIAMILTRAVKGELRLLFGFAAAVMGLATALSLSRGGIISIGAGLMFLLFMSVRLPKRSRGSSRFKISPAVSQAAVIVVLIATIAGGLLWMGADPVIKRVTEGQAAAAGDPKETFFSSRGWVWRDTFTMIRANPVFGVGLGAYETAFSIYTKSDGSLRVPQAHNDYLQIVADCGIPGAIIAIWFIVLLFRAVIRGSRSRDPLYAGVALGCGAGAFAMLVHSLFDFNLQVPSNALLFLLLSAVAVRVAAVVEASEGATPSAFQRDLTKIETESVSAARLARGAL